MLKVNQYEDITQIMMGREVNGSVLYWVAAYYIDGLLIDTGCHFTSEELVEYLKDKSIERVVNTHFHEDHIGGNNLIQEKFGVEIYAHPDSIPLINKRPVLNEYQEIVWGYPLPTKALEIQDRIITKKYIFNVFETQGHSVGHIILHEPNKGWCFSGDIFVSEKQKNIRTDENIYKIIMSLNKLKNIEGNDIILFTSIGTIFKVGKEAINNYLSFLFDLHRIIINLTADGFSTEEIRDKIFGPEGRLFEVTSGHYSTYNLIKGLQAITNDKISNLSF